MQGWSWMAALTLAAALVGVDTSNSLAGEPAAIKQKVKLSLRFDGLSAEGGEIEIRPGHAACRFQTIKFQTKDHPRSVDGKISLDPIEVETLSAGRDCSFAITLREPGQPDKTVRRNIRIVPTPEGKTAAPQSLTCFISSHSLNPVASKADETTRKK